jgi:hypothetical protein
MLCVRLNCFLACVTVLVHVQGGCAFELNHAARACFACVHAQLRLCMCRVRALVNPRCACVSTACGHACMCMCWVLPHFEFVHAACVPESSASVRACLVYSCAYFACCAQRQLRVCECSARACFVNGWRTCVFAFAHAQLHVCATTHKGTLGLFHNPAHH